MVNRIHVDLPQLNFVEVENNKMARNWLVAQVTVTSQPHRIMGMHTRTSEMK